MTESAVDEARLILAHPYLCFHVLQHLQQLGAKAAFDRTKADFSRLSPQPLYISDVLQSVSHERRLPHPCHQLCCV